MTLRKAVEVHVYAGKTTHIRRDVITAEVCHQPAAFVRVKVLVVL
jgi:hypothetical protein